MASLSEVIEFVTSALAIDLNRTSSFPVRSPG